MSRLLEFPPHGRGDDHESSSEALALKRAIETHLEPVLVTTMAHELVQRLRAIDADRLRQLEEIRPGTIAALKGALDECLASAENGGTNR